MGKTIIQQARGHGSKTYRVRPSAYIYKIGYPNLSSVGKAKIISLLNSSAHSCPLVKILLGNESFYIPAAQGIYEGQEIEIGGSDLKVGNIISLKNTVPNTQLFNIEIIPGDGGKIARTGGNSGIVLRKDNGRVIVLLSSKKEISINENSRATIGVVAGQGRTIKPIAKAGKKHYMMKARNKLWPRTSAVKMNAVDHPFGSGRGKRIKSKIAKRNSPPGTRVGHLRPRRTGRSK